MFLRYRATGASKDDLHEFRPDRVLSSRARIVEKLYSKECGERRTWEMFVADAKQGSITARRLVLWLVQSASHPSQRFEDMPDFTVGELSMEYSKQELREMRVNIEHSKEILDNEKAMMLAGLDQQIEEAEAGSDEPDPEPEVEEGKDPEPEGTTEPSTN